MRNASSKRTMSNEARFRMTLAGVATAMVVAGCHTQGSSSRPTTVTAAETPSPSAPAATAIAVPNDIASLVTRVSPSVVNITATQELHRSPGATDPFEFFFGNGAHPDAHRRGERGERDETVRRRGLGSGFILDAMGHVVTNAHVVENATKVKVTLSDERELEATVRGRDERLDLAVLEVHGAKDLPHVTLGRSDALRVGDYVLAIGNPFGLGHTVTMGIVSAKGRELGAGPYDDFIQTDASINPGNSGGPLFNLGGEVVGISTAVVSGGQGIGFAIPADALGDVFPQLLQNGAVARGRLGVSVQPVDAPLAKVLGLDKPKGAMIDDIEPGAAAARAGLKSGDVIVSVDDALVVHAHDLARLVARHPPGSHVRLLVVSGNGHATRRTVDATLDQLPEEDTSGGTKANENDHGSSSPTPGRGEGAGAQHDVGIEVGDARGQVIVKSVNPGGAAADDLEPGDVVLEVNGARITTSQQATTRLRTARPGKPVLLKISRDGRVFYVGVEP
jgi:serine protease Do